IWQYDTNNPFSSNMFAHPLAFRAAADGLGISYPTRPAIAKREYMFRYSEDLRAGIVGMASPDTRVAAYSDWSVTPEWRSSRGTLRATLGHGLPFVYFTKTDPSPIFVRPGADKGPIDVWHIGGAVLGITVAGHHYGLFAPTGSSWTESRGSYT